MPNQFKLIAIIIFGLAVVSTSAILVNGQTIPPPIHLPIVRNDLTPTPTATPTEMPTPIPTATPTAEPGVEVFEILFYSTEDGLEAVGGVVNNSDHNVGFVEIDLSLVREGQIVSRSDNWVYLDTMNPGMASPFRVFLDDPGEWDEYRWITSWEYVDYGPVFLQFVEAEGFVDTDGSLRHIGSVLNQTGVEQSDVYVVIGAFDADNHIVGVEWDYSTPSRLRPNERAGFDISIYNWYGAPDSPDHFYVWSVPTIDSTMSASLGSRKSRSGQLASRANRFSSGSRGSYAKIRLR